MPVRLLRLVTATSFFAVCCFLYCQRLKRSRRKQNNQNATEINEIFQGDEAGIQTATHEPKKSCGNDNIYGHLPISSILRTHLPGGRTRQSGSGARTGIGVANVTRGLHPRRSHSDFKIKALGFMYTYQVARSPKMQENFGEAQACSSSLEETVQKDDDGQRGKSPTIAPWPPSSSENSLENSQIDAHAESENPNQELFDSATSMTFASDSETVPQPDSPTASPAMASTQEAVGYTELELFDTNRNKTVGLSTITFENSGNLQENPVCHTPDSDRGIETICDESSSTSEECEEEDPSDYYSGNFVFQQQREHSVYWNKDFQDSDWYQRTCSPIAEEPEEVDTELYQCSETYTDSDSSTTDSSSDLVFETIFSTSQNPEEINDNDLADLKDDPDFVQLLLQNYDHDAVQQCHAFEESTDSNDSDAKQTVEAQRCSWWNVPSLQDGNDLPRQEEPSLIVEDLASQLSNCIIAEAQSMWSSKVLQSIVVPKENHCKILVQSDKTKMNLCSIERALHCHVIPHEQDEHFLQDFASKLAKHIIIQAIGEVFVPSSSTVQNSNANSSETDAPRIDLSSNGQGSIEDFGTHLANEIITQVHSIIIDGEKSLKYDMFQTTSGDVIARSHFELPIEDMVSKLEGDIILQALKTVASIQKLCRILVQTCIREAIREFVKPRQLPVHPSIELYALDQATGIINCSICHMRDNIFLHDIQSSTYQQLEVPKSLPKSISKRSSKIQSEHHTEMVSRSTQTDLWMPFPSIEKPSTSLHTSIHPKTISKIPKQLRHKVWKSLRRAKRKYECCKKQQKKPLTESYVTQASDDQTTQWALVLAHSLRSSKTSKDICILLDSKVSHELRKLLADVYDHVYLTTELYSHDDLALSMLGRPELAVTYTKLHCWRLTQYHKCVFLDADTLVLQNCDELFDREELSAVPDTGWPDCFNSGVFVFRPSLDTYAQLVSLALTKGSFDGGDQGLLNTYFGTWRADIAKRLSFVYNMQSNVSYTYAPAYLHHASGVKIVHFLGTDKPWLVRWRTDSGTVELADNQSWDLHVPFLQMWINIFREKVLPKLSEAAKNYIYKSTCMTVDQLFYRIATGDIYEYEKRPDESLPKTHFPSHEVPRVFEEAAPEPRRAVWEAPSVLEPRFIPHSAPPAPPSEPPGIPSMPPPPPPPPPSLPAAIPPPPPSWSAPCSESPRHIDVIEPTPSFYSDNSESKAEFVPPIQIIEEPCDPHWEAMFWHSVQSPWVPPSPPPPEEYQLPPSQQHYEPPIEIPTFGWFSADSGAGSPREEPPDIPESEPPSEHHTQTPLPQDSESSTETEDQEDVASNCETDSLTRMRSWEEGNIDYMGKDKFENIWKKLECMFTPPGPKSELEDLKESLKESFPQESVTQGGSVASSSLLDDDDDDVETLVPDEPPEPEEIWQGYPEGDYSGMFEWQEGRIDYCGRDRSDNIMRRLDFIISGGLVQDGRIWNNHALPKIK